MVLIDDMKKYSRNTKNSNYYISLAGAALAVVAFATIFGTNYSGESQTTFSQKLSGPAGAFVAPSLSGAVIASVMPAETITTIPVTCTEETEKSYDYDVNTFAKLNENYRVVKKCSDGSETVVKDWAPVGQ